ncbi:protein kinase [Pseudactinotalea sp. HY158]|uniref:protein kinase domain-containing protein n=1 Tax=Pseudactinotalea sp. HY158 TaxID=2654547 RepID=UPI00129CE2F1|nr:protein kinase [Pseudactinotalea sp. HY158]QGH69491.1 hypothetical protein GCE65_08125 [Pseudactinotalea sp. HY158]
MSGSAPFPLPAAAAADLRVLGPLGFGIGGTLWSAALPGGERVAVRHVAPPESGRLRSRERFEALTEVRSAHIARVREVRPVEGGLLVVSDLVPGPTLATVRAGTAGLSRPECWRLLVDLCEGLAALHARGLIHGDVAPANIVLCPTMGDGRVREAPEVRGVDEGNEGHEGHGGHRGTRPVLVDLGGSGDWEDGTAGFRAPELRTGAPAGAAADVWSAATVALWAVAEHERARLSAELAAALAAEPAARPTARALLDTGRTVAAETIEIPDPAGLARARLREQAQRDPTRLARGHRARRAHRPRRAPSTRPIRRADRHRRRPRRDPARSPERPQLPHLPHRRDRQDRQDEYHRRWIVRLARVVAIAVTAVAVALGAGTIAGGPERAPTGPEVGRSDAPASTVEPADAVRALTRLRDAALNDGDGPALLRLAAPGSPAERGDAALAEALRRRHPLDLETRTEVVAIGGSAAAPRVRVLLSQEKHERVDAAGRTWQVAGSGARCVELELSASAGRWRVWEVEACGIG